MLSPLRQKFKIFVASVKGLVDVVRLLADPFVDVHVRSEGCEDPGKTPNSCGVGYIKVDGTEYSPRQRGHNVVVVDGGTGNVLLEISKCPSNSNSHAIIYRAFKTWYVHDK